jgi:SHS2 domain-containing protein
MGYYKLIEHTADLGITVWGKSLKELFANAACALYELISDTHLIRPVTSFHIKVDALDRDDLLKNWLSELLYYFHVKDILLSRFEIESINDNSVISIVSGEKIDKARHPLKHEIKAVTFHGLKIMKHSSRLQTDIIFDV